MDIVDRLRQRAVQEDMLTCEDMQLAADEIESRPSPPSARGALKITTHDQFRRTIQALVETNDLIATERAYLSEFQDIDYLAGLEQQAFILAAMLREYNMRY